MSSGAKRLQSSRCNRVYISENYRLANAMINYCSDDAKKTGHDKPYSAGPIRIPKLKAKKVKDEGD